MIILSVLDGTWSRRSRGVNLEPLHASYRGTDGDDYLTNRADDNRSFASADDDASHRWERREKRREKLAMNEDFHHVLMVDSDADVARARERVRRMDVQTRFLCQLLDDMYRTGLRRGMDRPTTERCHRVRWQCGDFLEVPAGLDSITSDNLIFSNSGRVTYA